MGVEDEADDTQSDLPKICPSGFGVDLSRNRSRR
jgi:hypothetical protein